MRAIFHDLFSQQAAVWGVTGCIVSDVSRAAVHKAMQRKGQCWQQLDGFNRACCTA